MALTALVLLCRAGNAEARYEGNLNLFVGQKWLNTGEWAPVEAQVKSGKLKALAVTGPKRIPSALNVPTMIEAGVPDYELLNWHGVMVAAGTSRVVVDRLDADLRKTLALPEVRDRLLARLPGADTSVSTPDAFGALLRREFALWAKLVKEMNIRIE